MNSFSWNAEPNNLYELRNKLTVWSQPLVKAYVLLIRAELEEQDQSGSARCNDQSAVRCSKIDFEPEAAG
jgi:hypothetical protein